MEEVIEKHAGTPVITVTDALARYLAKKGLRHILLDVAFCKSCGGAVGELFARPATDREIQRLTQTNLRTYDCVDSAQEPLLVDGQRAGLVVAHPAIRLDSLVELDLRRIFGIADVRVRGAAYG